jgi:Anti-sigma-28 factor, FlgM
MSGTDPLTPAEPLETKTVTQLKEQIATRTYRVDSRAVAREMLFKMRMMALLREQAQRSWSKPDASRSDPSA